MHMIRTRRQPRHQLTLFTCSGKVLPHEIENKIKEFYDKQPTPNVVWDLSDADISGMSAVDVRQLAERTKQLAHSRKGEKTAIVASVDMPFGLARMYQTFAELAGQESQVEVFRSRKEALAWIQSG